MMAPETLCTTVPFGTITVDIEWVEFLVLWRHPTFRHFEGAVIVDVKHHDSVTEASKVLDLRSVAVDGLVYTKLKVITDMPLDPA
jgi:hypothetical protein